MRIVIDMQGAQSSASWNRGIGRYTISLAQAIVRNCGESEVFLALNGAFPEAVDRIRDGFDGVLPQENICVWHVSTPASQIGPANAWRRQCGELIREAFLASLQPDVVLVSSLFEGLVDDAVTSIKRFPNLYLTAVILYDLIPYINSSPYLENPLVEAWYLEKIEYLRRADLCLAISQSSSQEGVDYLGFSKEKCVNISTDADSCFYKIEVTPKAEHDLRERYGLALQFVMYTGGIDHRKNIEGLIRAYAKLAPLLRATHQLAIVCAVQEGDRYKLLELAKSEGLSANEVVLTGFVPEADLLALYNLCAVFVFPSWHEGFGLPALEAMRCGAPVLGAETSSLPEVIGLPEALFDPHSDEAIRQSIERVLTDADFRQRLVDHGALQASKFSWDETARRALGAMSRAVHEVSVQGEQVSSPAERLKLAYFSPLPPERSGISDYSAELLPTLSQYYEIEVVVAQETVSDPWILANCPVRTVDWFKSNVAEYDRVLYHFGNSAFHQHMFSLLESNPGVVVLHDFYLSGVRQHMDAWSYAPGCFNQQLFRAHGYKGLRDRMYATDVAEVIWAYPCSLDVIEDSVGVIVHSANSIALSKQWYGANGAGYAVIPLMRVPATTRDSALARKTLGFAEQDFIVCAFGMLGPTKLNHRLLASWLDSTLSRAGHCHLVFVGQNDAGEYGSQLLRMIAQHPKGGTVRIIGWADQETFRNYLAVADLGVQLRTLSRGETSGTVLDCMNYGVPTIVNANGSMADLADDTVYKLPDEFTDQELIEALETMWRDDRLRNQVGQSAQAIIAEQHDPVRCAKQYQMVIENFYKRNNPVVSKLLRKIGNNPRAVSPDGELRRLADVIATSFPAHRIKRTLLVDLSELVQRDARSGIQRVVRSILREWLINPPSDYRVEPVYATAGQVGYRYARQFTQRLLGRDLGGLQDELIDYARGDRFVCLDLQPHVQVEQRAFYKTLRRQGVAVKFVVYDLLCVLHPEGFPPGAGKQFTQWLEVVCESDGVICISKAVADELDVWRREHVSSRKRPFTIDWFHLGADIDSSIPTTGIPTKSAHAFKQLHQSVSFLMVGTLEPRKGHQQVLAAFEMLWKAHQDVNLVIVGKRGWLVEQLVTKLSKHPELNKHLFFLEGISDEYLEKVYSASSCLIAASYAEGFGLPLIEAAQHKLPIIARDIPVFREVAGNHATYFNGTSPNDLAESIKNWLARYEQGMHPKSDEMPWLKWKESASNLLQIVTQSKN